MSLHIKGPLQDPHLAGYPVEAQKKNASSGRFCTLNERQKSFGEDLDDYTDDYCGRTHRGYYEPSGRPDDELPIAMSEADAESYVSGCVYREGHAEKRVSSCCFVDLIKNMCK